MSTLKDAIPEKQQEEIFEKLLNIPENKICADCSNKGPRWASLDFGVFICMNCAGHHRNLGPSITRVRSVKLDSWRLEFIEMMESVGNARANGYFEKNLPSSKKADAAWQTNDIRKFIGDKYVKKLFAPLDRDPPMATIGKDSSPKKAQFDGFRGFDQPAQPGPRSSTPQKKHLSEPKTTKCTCYYARIKEEYIEPESGQ